MIKTVIKKLFFLYKKFLLKKTNVFIEKNVSFKNTKFKGFNRICKNSLIDNSIIGKFSYIGWNSTIRNAEIGSYCSIAPFVEIIYGTHPINLISTHPIFYSNRKQCGYSFLNKSKIDEFNLIGKNNKSIIIENDVWIGYGVKIIEGIRISNGAVVLAGSVVTRDVEPYSIVGGVPAKFIKYRFDDEERKILEEIKWWDRDQIWIEKNFEFFINPGLFFKNMREK